MKAANKHRLWKLAVGWAPAFLILSLLVFTQNWKADRTLLMTHVEVVGPVSAATIPPDCNQTLVPPGGLGSVGAFAQQDGNMTTLNSDGSMTFTSCADVAAAIKAGWQPMASSLRGIPMSTTSPVAGQGLVYDGTKLTYFSTAKPAFSAVATSLPAATYAPDACVSTSVAVTGATQSMAVVVTPQTYPGDALSWKGSVPTAGVVAYRVCNYTAATAVSTASAYNVRVLQ